MRNKRGVLPYGWFLGLVRSGNTFVPLNGTTKSNMYIKWDKGEPNNAGGIEKCVMFVAATRKMNDVPCTDQYEFICVSRPAVPQPKIFCYVSDLVRDPEMNDIVKQNRDWIEKNYFPIPGSKALYKHYMTTKTLIDAKTTCENEGASLYYPETEQESNAVLSFMQHCNGSLAYGWYLGIVRSGTNFRPISGGTSNMYIQWNSGEQNLAASSNNCILFVASQKRMIDVLCTSPFQFICKSRHRVSDDDYSTSNPGVPSDFWRDIYATTTDGAVMETKGLVHHDVGLTEKNYFSVPNTTALYKFYETFKTFADAKTTCENDGASLYYPETKEESRTVLRFLRNKRGGVLPYGWFLGLVRSDNTFMPLNGTTKSNKYIRWDKGEPNNAGGVEDCVVFVAATRNMNDVPCTDQYKFICVSRPAVPQPKIFCYVSDLVRDPEMNDIVKQNRDWIEKNYFPIPEMKALYKHYMTTKTLTDAKTTCENEGASLYYPETEQESNAVLSFMQHCNGSLAYGWYLGIVRSGTNFRPISGGTSNMYIQWNSGEQNLAASSNNCILFVASQKRMIDVLCTSPFQFICKSRHRESDDDYSTSNPGVPSDFWRDIYATTTDGAVMETKGLVHHDVGLTEKNYFSVPNTTALYMFYETFKTFADAKTTCENDGASLYYPETKEESRTVLRFLRNKRGGVLPYGWFLGLVRSDNTFVPLNGTTKSNKYIRWDKGEPNNAGGVEDCVVFVAATRKMNDVPCTDQYKFICVSRPAVPQPKIFCYVSDLVRDPEMNDIVKQNRDWIEKNYFPIPEMKALYKHYMTTKTLTDAKTTCENEGASLYYPETEQESNAVLSFMQHCNGSLAYGWYLGIVRSGTNFGPVDRASMSNVYLQWNLGEPNNSGGSENCVVYVASQMKMNDVPCTYQFQFICKSQPRK